MTTPPPQGQNPFAQGQPPQGENPFAQGQPPQGYPQQPGAGFAPVPPQRPKRSIKQYLRGGIVVVAVIAAGVGYLASRHDPDTAKVGDCMSISNPDSSTDPGLKVVGCGDAKAKFKVAQKKTDDSGCDRTKYAEYTETGKNDFTLCLEEIAASK
ncbi:MULTISPECIES: LppU/SCO3897 family protein [unclassified Streptomyces]|uniref:Uncharacterized protein n=1 Tax=Streptomyces sp. NBC_01393 TaxID=2903851 RepID=A0AAU3I1W1_9ACTN|nr:hypothetical protein [Streptomyces sp. NBC_00151]WRZ40752.1 hypothetical protein OG915_23495 [Streptomyces sp. NBC_00151]